MFLLLPQTQNMNPVTSPLSLKTRPNINTVKDMRSEEDESDSSEESSVVVLWKKQPEKPAAAAAKKNSNSDEESSEETGDACHPETEFFLLDIGFFPSWHFHPQIVRLKTWATSRVHEGRHKIKSSYDDGNIYFCSGMDRRKHQESFIGKEVLKGRSVKCDFFDKKI